METIIAYEGRETTDGRLISVNALYWKDLPLPVFKMVDNFVGSLQRVGQIVDLRRDGEGRVLATTDIEIPVGMVLSLDGAGPADFVWEESDSKLVCTSMRIAAGTLLPLERWTWNNVGRSL